jgi:hypothetical protein
MDLFKKEKSTKDKYGARKKAL